jgi:predicted DsbA family dithiol-disulfide isomerase
MTVIEVFADVRCPFTHIGLRRLIERRAALGRVDVGLHVRAWPLELVNDAPLEAHLIAEEVEELRAQVAPDLFAGFDVTAYPASSLPALMATAGAYERSLADGERVSLALRDAMFEEGRNIALANVLRDIAGPVDLDLNGRMAQQVRYDWAEGRARGVIGSPHFFVGELSFFCPSLHIARVDGHLRIESDPTAFDDFLAVALGIDSISAANRAR